MNRALLRLVCASLIFCVSACGGGGGGTQTAANQPAQPTPPVVVTPPPPPAVISNFVSPVPTGLWQAPTNVLPKNGNYVYLASDDSKPVPDFIGAGQTYLFSDELKTNFYMRITEGVARLEVLNELNNYLWSADFAGIGSSKQLQVGLYANATRHPFQSADVGGFNVGNNALQRNCNAIKGWFAIDRLEYSNGKLAEIDIRFEQHCEGLDPALRGQIHWVFDTTPQLSPGPISIPTSLWKADPLVVPKNGNYVYLKSDLGNFTGDFYGRASTYLYTPINAILKVEAVSSGVSVTVNGDYKWAGIFRGRSDLGKLQTGYYPDVGGDRSTNDPSRGLEYWSGTAGPTGGGRVGAVNPSWFIVDDVQYEGSNIKSIDLRFEQHDGGLRAAIRGQLHWDSSDLTVPPGPQNPPPNDLWMPPIGSIPATGNYVYLQSDQGDFVGQGQNYLYTPANANVRFFTYSATPQTVEIRVEDSDIWRGEFQGLVSMTALQPGYYPGVIRVNDSNPTKGGLDWGGHGRGCNELSGWFVVDNVTYTNGTVTALSVRFEQHCEKGASALRGAIRWSN